MELMKIYKCKDRMMNMNYRSDVVFVLLNVIKYSEKDVEC